LFQNFPGGYEAGGQNLAIYFYITSKFKFEKHCKYNFSEAMEGWFNELYDPGFLPTDVKPFSATDPKTLHFTQVS
jgi:hypothetical protein